MRVQPRFILGALLVLTAAGAQAQSTVPVAQEFEKLHFRSIGPATMSGRVADLAVYEANPAVYYVGTAHGGVFKTTSNGAMFTPLFQNEGLISVGDITISQKDPNLVWVGAGESNNRQSTSWGGGVYKSTDGGKTWQHMGLKESKHINRIVINPNNNDIVLVAATGALYGPGGDRGVYKTTDGGRTWKQVLKVDDDTGANDLVMSSTDPNVLYASTYQRRRSACCMNGGGPGSGVWKSTDGGETWSRLSGNGWPAGPLGRIALDAFRKNHNIVYATVEGPAGRGQQPQGDAAPGAAPAPSPTAQQQLITGLYRSDDGGSSWKKVSSINPRPMYFSQVLIDPTNADRVYMGGVGMQMTVDGGKTFSTDAAMAIHDDIHAIWVNPANPDHIVIGGDGGVAHSYDMSKTWTFIPNIPAGLFYHVSFDMEQPYNICGGMQDNYNWCGPSASRHNRGIFNYDWFQIQGGDGFFAVPDLKDSRIIYTESQDGNIIRRNKITGESKNIRPTAANVVNYTKDDQYRFHWDTPILLSPHDPTVLIVAANKVFKSTDRGDSWTAISPDLTTNTNRNDIVTMGLKNSETTIARNDGISQWPAIITLAESPRQAGVFYTGTDDGVVSVTKDGGKTWTNVTKNIPGFPQDAYVSEVVPSRYDAGTVYVTVANYRQNDYKPYVWVSNDFGATFRSINNNLAGEVVRTLTEDHKNPDVLYLGTETGIMLTLDRGQSWRRLKANLPTVRVDEITLHPRDNAMLVATHGRSLFVLDHLEPIQQYKAAQVVAQAKLFDVPSALQWKSKDDRNDEFWGHQFFVGENPPVDATISFFAKDKLNDVKVRISDVAGKQIRTITVPEAKRVAGINTVCWDMRYEPIQMPQGQGQGGPGGGGQFGQQQQSPIPGVPTPLPEPGYLPANPCATGTGGGGGGGGGGGFGGGGGGGQGPHVLPGTYNVALLVDGKQVDSKTMKIVGDPQVQMTVAQRQQYNAVALELHELQRKAQEAATKLNTLGTQIAEAQARIKAAGAGPSPVSAEVDAVAKDFEAIRVKFGVQAPRAPGQAAPQQGGPGGGGFGRGGPQFDPANVLGRVAAVKQSILSIWEAPSAALVKQYNELKLSVPRAVAEADAFVARATPKVKP